MGDIGRGGGERGQPLAKSLPSITFHSTRKYIWLHAPSHVELAVSSMRRDGTHETLAARLILVRIVMQYASSL